MTGPDNLAQSEAHEREAVAHLGEDNLEAARICAELASTCATRALTIATRDAGIPSGYVLAERCNIAESAYGRQCGRPMRHPDACDFTVGGGA